MFLFVCGFFPPIIALYVYEKLQKSDFYIKDCVYYYCTSAVVVNLFTWIILRLRYAVYYFDLYDNGLLVKYLAVASVAAVGFGVFTALMGKYVSIHVEESENENESENKK